MDYSKLTNDELDKLIAEKRGWKICDCAHCKEHNYHIWLDPNDGLNLEDNPSFTTDPRYAMELLEEMLTSGNIVKLSNGDCDSVDLDIFVVQKYLCVNIKSDIHVSTKDTKRTISEAWLKWSENE